MTASAHPTPNLGSLPLESTESDHAVDGVHHRHTTTPDRLPDVARAFLDAGYFLEMITCEDRRATDQKMRLAYTFNRFDTADRHALFADLPPDIPGAEAPTITHLYPAADWFEREVFDMYGVRFTDHPNLKRLLLPEDATFHALLKDFGRIEDAHEQPAE